MVANTLFGLIKRIISYCIEISTKVGTLQGTADSINTKVDNIQGGIDTVSSQISALSSTSGVVKKVQHEYVPSGAATGIEQNVYLSTVSGFPHAEYKDINIDAVDIDKAFVAVDALRGTATHMISRLMSSTKLRVYVSQTSSTSGADSTDGFYWQVIEFY